VITDINNLGMIMVSPIGGAIPEELSFRNTTNFRFVDFHFRSSTQSGVWTGNGGMNPTFFGNVSPNNIFTGIDFATGGTGVGIAPGTTFTITFENFQSNSPMTIQPTTVPEPTTIILLSTGLAGVAIKSLKKLRSGKNRSGKQ